MPNLVALLFGMAVVIFFSYERFNRTTDDAGKQMQRLVNLLTPDKLRSRRVVLNAYGFYTATFVLIYFFFCAYARLLPALGGPNIDIGAKELPAPADVQVAVAGFSSRASGANFIDALWSQPLSQSVVSDSGRSSWDIGIDASTSLAVALLIVGLAPSFPILQKFEIWMRGAAHRLAGIPTRVLQIQEDLRGRSLDFDIPDQPPADTLMIPRGDWLRLCWYKANAWQEVGSPEEFFSDLKLVVAVSVWILEPRLRLANPQDRDRFSELEQALRERKEQLIERLDARTGYSPLRSIKPPGAQSPQRVSKRAAADEVKAGSWDRLSKELAELADDMRIILALYAEHEIIVGGGVQSVGDGDETPRQTEVAKENSATAQRNARAKLLDLLDENLAGPINPSSTRSYTMVTALWSFFIVLVLAIAWSQFPGGIETKLRTQSFADPYWRLFDYGSSAIMVYFVPIVVALSIRDGWKQFYHWHNMRVSNWTVFLPQAAFVLVASWTLATVFTLATTLWQAGVDTGWRQAVSPWQTLRYVFAYNAPAPLKGAVLALLLIILLDTWQARRRTGSPPLTITHSLIWATVAALLLAVVAAITRGMTALAGSLQASVPRQGLDAIDRGLIAYAAIFSALLGFCVVFSVAEVLRNQRRPALVREPG